jgi:hypothetical protein
VSPTLGGLLTGLRNRLFSEGNMAKRKARKKKVSSKVAQKKKVKTRTKARSKPKTKKATPQKKDLPKARKKSKPRAPRQKMKKPKVTSRKVSAKKMRQFRVSAGISMAKGSKKKRSKNRMARPRVSSVSKPKRVRLYSKPFMRVHDQQIVDRRKTHCRTPSSRTPATARSCRSCCSRARTRASSPSRR